MLTRTTTKASDAPWGVLQAQGPHPQPHSGDAEQQVGPHRGQVWGRRQQPLASQLCSVALRVTLAGLAKGQATNNSVGPERPALNPLLPELTRMNSE